MREIQPLNKFVQTVTHIFIVYYQSSCSVNTGKLDKCLHFVSIFLAWKVSICLIIRYVSLNIIKNAAIRKTNIFTETRAQNSFRVCNLSSCDLFAEINNFVIYAVLLSCLVSELQKTSSPGIELRTALRGCDLCFCNILFKTNNFDPGAVILSCLVSELQETPSPGLEPGNFSGVLTFLCYLLCFKE
jgi:hypothetical protein